MANQRSNRFTVEISGNPGTTANMIKQLSTNPYLLLNPENHLAMMLPDALNTTDYAPKVGISVRDIHFLVLGGLALTTEVLNAGVHFIIDPARLTKLFTDMEAHGASFLPIQGNASTAMPRAHFSLTDFIAKLPIECRVIEANEVFYDGDPDNAGTGTCYDWLTPRLFITGEGHERHVLLSQFVMMLPDYHFKGTPSTGGRSSEAFTDILEQMLSATSASNAYRDFDSLSQHAQANALVAWVKRTRPPVMLMPYVTNAYMEVVRRAEETRAAQLAPLLAENWRYAFPFISNLWPNESADIGSEMAALANSLGIGGIADGITIEAIISLSTILKDLGAFATASTNAERTAEIVRASKHAAHDKDKDISVESKQMLQNDPVYIDLKNLLAEIDLSEPHDIARLLLKHDHPAGILYMNGKFAPDDFWKRLGSARCESVVQGIFIETISFNTKGDPAEYGAILAEGIGKSLLKGTFNRNWWTTLAPLVAKREGIVTHDKIDKRLRGLPATALYADADAMRILEFPLRMIMKLLGFHGNDAGSFIKTWRSMCRMAGAIEGLPDYCQPKRGSKRASSRSAR